MALGAAFDLQRVDAHVHQARHAPHCAQVPGIHDVSAVLVLAGRHVLALAMSFLQQHRLAGVSGLRLVYGDDVAGFCLLRCVDVVLPAAGVGAGALVGVPVGHVSGQQAAAGIGDTQGAVNKDFQLYLGTPLADLRDLIE